MSGHSKWATIKRKKGANDAKRGRIFTKLIKEISVAARMGGGDPTGNPRLRLAIESARSQNMPSDKIERAIKKGTGELEGVSYEEVVYEGYGIAGVALLIEVMTDNKNRTVAELRSILSKHGGNLGETGSVGWIFEKKGSFQIDKAAASEETLMDVALSAGAEDIVEEAGTWAVTCPKEDFATVREALEKAKIPVQTAELTMVPKTTVALNENDAGRMLKLMDILEDHDDVQHVYANFDISDEIIEKLG
jgi:YebC/PmpR family DNA-binding regulatory protein